MPALKRIHVLLAALVVLNGFDAGVTLFFLESTRAWEMNPFLAAAYQYGGPAGFLLAKSIAAGTGCLALWYGRNFRAAILAATIVAGLYLLLALYEVVLLALFFGGYL